MTILDGVSIISPSTSFEDFRGTYTEIWNKQLYPSLDWVQDDVSVSYRNVLRGIHGDDKTWKLISCLYGAFYFVVVNNKPESTQYGQWWATTLSDKDRKQVLVPPKFGNAHLVLTDVAVFHYKQTQYYDRVSQFTLKWNDPFLNIYWPINNPVLSERDYVGE